MRRFNRVFSSRKILLLCCLIGLWLLIPWANANNAKVQLLYFSNRTCPDCQLLKKEFLPKIRAQFQNHLEIKTVELASIEDFKLLLKLEKRMGRKLPKTPPFIIVGKDVLEGEGAIRNGLEPIINQYLKTGGIEWP